jgi:protein-disulfide isomerase
MRGYDMGKKNKKSKLEGKDNGTRNIVIGMILLVIVVGAITAISKNHTNSSASAPSAVAPSDGYGIEFNKNAPVKVDFYEDFQCPHCRDFEAINNTYINSIVSSGKVHAVFHPMSFIGPESILTAAAAACASDEGKFLEMHKALYQNQPATENSGAWTDASLIQLGSTIGLNSAKFQDCVNKGSYINWTKNVENAAGAANVNQTPTVFLNGKQLPQADYLDPAAFQAAFKAAGVK